MENDSNAADHTDPPDPDSSSNKGECDHSYDIFLDNEQSLSRSEETIDGEGSRSGSHWDKSILPDTDEIVEEIDRFMESLSGYLNEKNSGNHNDNNLPEIPDVVEIFVKMVQMEMDKYDSQEKFGVDPDKDLTLTCMVGRIVRLTNLLGEASQDHKTVAPWLSRTTMVLQRAMTFMEEELRKILDEFTGNLSPEYKRKNSNPSFSGSFEPPKTPKASSSVPSFRHSAKIHYHNSNNGPYTSSSSSAHSRQGSYSSSVGSPLSDTLTEDNENYPGISEESINQMRRIVVLMMTAGYESECSQVYSLLRRNAFKYAMMKRGYEKVSAEDMQKMAWDVLENHITRWVKVVKQAAKNLFPEEKKLCDSVFQDYPVTSDGIMTGLARGEIILFLSFADAVAGMKRSSERLFRILDVYETLTEMMTTVEEKLVVSSEKANDLKSEISCIRNKLGEFVMSIFTELEDSIKSDVARHPVPSGAVHPLTRYIMNYVRYTCDYKDLLEQVFDQGNNNNNEVNDDDQKKSSKESFSSLTGGGGGLRAAAAAATGRRSFRSSDDDDSNQGGPSSAFGSELVRIMGMLDANLEAKAKLYKDPSLRCIFLMNNGRYILQKIKESPEMRELVGNNTMRKRSAELRTHHKNYQRETWSRVLQCLNHEGLQVHGKVHKPLLKERFKNFNNMFDDIRRVQSGWVVSDEQLQSELRVSISAVMIPAYRAFVAKFAQYFSSGRQTEKYVKYQPDEIETAINELFDGNPVSLARKKS